GLLGAIGVDVMRGLTLTDATAFGVVFLAEATLFLAAAALAVRVIERPVLGGTHQIVPGE
ncbi:PucC family protein, partial [Meridianimarinicoccus aquatilis]